MSIIFNESKKQYYLGTENTSYVIELLDGAVPLHRYYGKAQKDIPLLTDSNVDYNVAYCVENTCVPCARQTATLPLEYPVFGTGDLRTPAIFVKFADGSGIVEPEYVSHKIIKGKPQICGMQSSYSQNDAKRSSLFWKIRSRN